MYCAQFEPAEEELLSMRAVDCVKSVLSGAGEDGFGVMKKKIGPSPIWLPEFASAFDKMVLIDATCLTFLCEKGYKGVTMEQKNVIGEYPASFSKRERQEQFRNQCVEAALDANESMRLASFFPDIPQSKIRIVSCPNF